MILGSVTLWALLALRPDGCFNVMPPEALGAPCERRELDGPTRCFDFQIEPTPQADGRHRVFAIPHECVEHSYPVTLFGGVVGAD